MLTVYKHDGRPKKPCRRVSSLIAIPVAQVCEDSSIHFGSGAQSIGFELGMSMGAWENSFLEFRVDTKTSTPAFTACVSIKDLTQTALDEQLDQSQSQSSQSQGKIHRFESYSEGWMECELLVECRFGTLFVNSAIMDLH